MLKLPGVVRDFVGSLQEDRGHSVPDIRICTQTAKKKKKKSVPWRQSHQYGRVCTIPEEQGELDWGESSGRGGGFATHLRKAAVRTGDAITASCGTLGKSLDFTYSS